MVTVTIFRTVTCIHNKNNKIVQKDTYTYTYLVSKF